jgi:hypothetical protein
VVHSAILTEVRLAPGKSFLDYAAVLRTKNGLLPEADATLEELIEGFYGESYNVYRKR